MERKIWEIYEPKEKKIFFKSEIIIFILFKCYFKRCLY